MAHVPPNGESLSRAQHRTTPGCRPAKGSPRANGAIDTREGFLGGELVTETEPCLEAAHGLILDFGERSYFKSIRGGGDCNGSKTAVEVKARTCLKQGKTQERARKGVRQRRWQSLGRLAGLRRRKSNHKVHEDPAVGRISNQGVGLEYLRAQRLCGESVQTGPTATRTGSARWFALAVTNARVPGWVGTSASMLPSRR